MTENSFPQELGTSQDRCIRFVCCLLFIAVAVILGGCSSRPAVDRIGAAAPEARPEWREAHFFIRWPDGEPPAWHIDEMIANEVVKPALIQESAQISLWRFHRRAARDATGHRFRFLFYASPDTGERIFENLRAQPALIGLQRSGRVLRVELIPASGTEATAVEATSDPHWPLELQKSWPFYIMGVSRMWLDLLEQFAARQPNSPRDEALYRRVHEEVTELWRTWGRHAWLHHLNALYAYQPLQIDRERLERF